MGIIGVIRIHASVTTGAHRARGDAVDAVATARSTSGIRRIDMRIPPF
ncbi:hypothetical protein [Cognatilysobacter segetis]|nr:hypothetical protein [Lysobacter segetis]